MKYFLSTLTDSGYKNPIGMKPIFTLQFLAVTIVNEQGERLTLLNNQFNPSDVSKEALDKFLVEGSYLGQGWAEDTLVNKANSMQDLGGVPHSKMRKAIQDFTGTAGYLYTYESPEDIVALKSIKLSLDGFYVRDLKQYGDEVSEMINDDFGINEDSEYPVPAELNTTLSKALWLLDLYKFIEDFKSRNNLK